MGIGVVEGFFLHGAIASTVAHDSHNLIAVGDNDQDILLGIQALEKAGGRLLLGTGWKAARSSSASGMRPADTGTTEQVQRALANMKKLCVEMGMQRSWTHSRRYSFCRCRFCRKFGLPTEASLIPWNTGICRLVHHRLGLARKKKLADLPGINFNHRKIERLSA